MKDPTEKPGRKSKHQWVLVIPFRKLENVLLASLVPLAKSVPYLWHLN